MEIIPAIDIIDGKVVRLTGGDYSRKKIYEELPEVHAKKFEDAGIKRLHLVDLDGAKAGMIKNWKILEAIATQTKLVIDFGGGIKTEKDLELVFNSGAAMATIGSVAVKNEPALSGWLKKFGAEKFLLGADVKDEKISVNAWSETTELNLYDFIERWLQKGIKQIFCTDIKKDGMMKGPSVELYAGLSRRFPQLHLIASGGVTVISDLEKLQAAGCKGVIIGKALYEGTIQLSQLKPYLS